jgi:AraC-like DNA-binding protein
MDDIQSVSCTRERSVRGTELSRAIGVSHLSWTFDRDSTGLLVGDVVSRGIGPLRVSWLKLSLGSNGWSGQRTADNIRTSAEAYLTIVMPLSGSINLAAGSNAIQVASQELAMWDSTLPLRFDIGNRHYEQISVLVPQRVLRARVETCAALHCSHVDSNNLLSELCVQHMSTLVRFLSRELRPYETSLSSATTGLVDAMIASLYRAPHDRERLVAEMKNHIECYISDDDLSPSSLAAAFEVSTRYAHKLFEQDGCTIGEWILRRRLDRSADELLLSSASITDIAFKWGFKDLGHYSRRFKSRFGHSPSAYRKQASRN